MFEQRPNPVDSFESLRHRVERLIRVPVRQPRSSVQLPLSLPPSQDLDVRVVSPRGSIAEFIGFMSDVLPRGDVYLFGGVLRDLALLGRRGFNSDIDLVVEGEWDHCIPYLESLAARRNKFGGYRLEVGGWPVDIWNARDTWAIKRGWIEYRGIASLTQTTVLNWDAILMNWRSRSFIYRDNYLDELKERLLDVVLEENPNPLGMAVRVFRHLSVKDARRVTAKAAEYLANCTARYSYAEIHKSELGSYGNSAIELALYEFFARLKENEHLDMRARFEAASESLKKDSIAVPLKQAAWKFDEVIENR